MGEWGKPGVHCQGMGLPVVCPFWVHMAGTCQCRDPARIRMDILCGAGLSVSLFEQTRQQIH